MRKVAYVVAVAVVVALCWQAVAILKCKRKNAEFKRRVEAINSEVRQRIPVGASRADVEKFFDEHGMHHYEEAPGHVSVEGYIEGSVLAEGGCAPFGCGTDRVAMIMRVKMTASGTVAEVPKIGGMYVDCV